MKAQTLLLVLFAVSTAVVLLASNFWDERKESLSEAQMILIYAQKQAIKQGGVPPQVKGGILTLPKPKATRSVPTSTTEQPEEVKQEAPQEIIVDSISPTSPDGVPLLPPTLPYWPRPFGMTRDNINTKSGAMLQRMYGQENDGAAVLGPTPIEPSRWAFPKAHTQSWLPHWKELVSSINDEPLKEGIEVLAKAFVAYDADIHSDNAVPAYGTICGGKDCPILHGHFKSQTALGRFILILNTEEEKWVSACKILEKAFPQRFVVDYSMLKTRQLLAEQDEYKRRHSGSDGIAEPSSFVSITDSIARHKSEDAEDAKLDAAEGAVSTKWYRWHLRNLHPDLLAVPLSKYHSVSMGWNRIVNFCFRGQNPVDYCFVANGDFYLEGQDLPTFAKYTREVITGGPTDRISLGGYQDSLSFAFFAHTYNAWKRFGEFDESLFPMYHEDNEFHARIMCGGMDMFQAYDHHFSEHHFKHVGSLSRRDNPALEAVLGSQSHMPYIDAKYRTVQQGLTHRPTYKHPFNNGDIDHRNAWAIDVKYRKCNLGGRGGCNMDIIKIQRLLRGEDQTQYTTAPAEQ